MSFSSVSGMPPLQTELARARLFRGEDLWRPFVGGLKVAADELRELRLERADTRRIPIRSA